jgi:hypothetical protein
MSKEDNQLGPADKVIDMGDLYGNPIPEEKTKKEPELQEDDITLSNEEEELLKKKLAQIRKADPFIYR